MLQPSIYKADNAEVDTPQADAQREVQKEMNHESRMPRIATDDIIHTSKDEERDGNRQYKKEYVPLMPHNL
ncbi:hypothetical protein JCM16496A_30240 [Bacteroides rodentium JCM 16496]